MKIIGHRGCRNEEPENTLLGIKSAISKGVQAIEIDIHLTKDGHLVVIHDDTVDRTTNGKGKIKELTLSQIRELDAGRGEKIPLLDEVLQLIKKHKMEVQIELKAPDCEEKVVACIKKNDLTSLCTVISFVHPYLLKIKELEPTIKTACLIHGLPVDPASMIKDAAADGLSVSIQTIDKELVMKCHKAGYFVVTWNANRVDDFKKVYEMGVDYIATDVPSLIVPVAKKMKE